MTNLPVKFVSHEVNVAIQVGLLHLIQNKWKYRQDLTLRRYLKEAIQALRFVRKNTLCYYVS